jgi:hypothetical protein
MDFSKLSKNDKLATYGAIATIVGGVIGYAYGVAGILAVLAAIGVLAVVFMPQMSPTTTLPGSHGSLLLLLGGGAAVLMILALLVGSSLIFFAFGIRDLLFLIAVAGSLVMGWAGWQAFQAEGGKFQIGTTPPPSGPPPSTPPPESPPPPSGPPTS